ncbi:MAG TPA: hypothetical protein ENK52_01955 [Saprospiraceae bacterium]|nr:hypothetical protein [Saprospiraceae bacterium]
MEENSESLHIEESLALTCPSCGSELAYSAEKKKITCGHCGYLEEIDIAHNKVVERNLAKAIEEMKDFIPEETEKKVFDCQNCGSKFMVEHKDVKIKCGFCGSSNINLEAYQHQYIQPTGIIPFYVSREDANNAFDKWIKRGWFHPNKLKRLSNIEDLHGVYIPFWTYDAHTTSQWSGQAGHYYNKTAYRIVNGKQQAHTVREIRWTSHSGQLQHFFDDILVVASTGLKQSSIERILPFQLNEVVNFDARLMAGWETEIYTIEIDKGYQSANNIMDYKIRNMCSAQLGGDTQRNLHVSSHKSGQTFKHIILPIWICSYLYQNKLYHFTINGQTGKVYGQKPTSWIKIAILVLIFILFIFGIWYLRESGVLKA